MKHLKIDLVDSRFSLIGRRIDDVDAVRLQTWQNEKRSRLRRIVVATGAGVPAEVMQLVADVRHLKSVDHLHKDWMHGFYCMRYLINIVRNRHCMGCTYLIGLLNNQINQIMFRVNYT